MLWILASPGAFADRDARPPFEITDCARRLVDRAEIPDLSTLRFEYHGSALRDVAAVTRDRMGFATDLRQWPFEPSPTGSLTPGHEWVVYVDDEGATPLRVSFGWSSGDDAARITRVRRDPLDRFAAEKYQRSALLRDASLALGITTHGLERMREADLDVASLDDAIRNPVAPPVSAVGMRGVVWLIGHSRWGETISLNLSRPGGTLRVLEVHRPDATQLQVYLNRSGRAHDFLPIRDGRLQGIRLVIGAGARRTLETLRITTTGLIDVARSAPGVIFTAEFGQFYGRFGRYYYEVSVVREDEHTWAVADVRHVAFEKFRRFETFVRRVR